MGKQKAEIIIREVPHGSAAYQATLDLRDTIMRKPLGLQFTPHDLEADKVAHHLACYQIDELIGCLVLQPCRDGDIQMRQVAVRTDRQRTGVGTALVSYSEKFARGLGYRRMTMHARETAMAFYERLGYTKVGERFTEVTIPHWEMVKRLD